MAAQRPGLTQALGASGVCEKNLQVAYGSTACFAFLVFRRESYFGSIAESGTLTALPPHGTAQVAQSALRWQSR